MTSNLWHSKFYSFLSCYRYSLEPRNATELTVVNNDGALDEGELELENTPDLRM